MREQILATPPLAIASHTNVATSAFPDLDSHATIQGAIARYGYDGGRITRHADAEGTLFWRKFLADCAMRGASPYGISRHNRRAAWAMLRRDAGKRRVQAREAAAEAARKATAAMRSPVATTR